MEERLNMSRLFPGKVNGIGAKSAPGGGSSKLNTTTSAPSGISTKLAATGAPGVQTGKPDSPRHGSLSDIVLQ